MKKKLLILLFILVSIPFYAQWWEPQISGVNANLNDVYCITEDIVVIVGDGGIILKTTDGGLHWVQKPSGTTNFLKKVQFVNNTIGYAVGDGGTLLKTTDGGESWTSITTGVTTGLSGLSVLNESTFFISGYNGLIKRTNDGGATFIDQSYGQNYFFKTIQFLNENIGYACSYEHFGGDANAFIKTTDGGQTWALALDQNTSCFYFLNENIGFLKDGNGLHKTSNGGTTVTDIAGGMDNETADMFALNENVLWNVGNNLTLCDCSWFCINKTNLAIVDPELQQTSNCYAETSGGVPFSAIHFANETKGYAVGWWGMILKNATGIMENLATTEFDKKDFVKMYPNPSSNQVTISFLEKQTTPFSVEITDFLGKKIFSKSYENQKDATISIESFSNGVYFVKLQSAKGTSIQKLIKE
jgi:photosystem II stability/assembly factor-like uncharacterized protein